MMLQQQAMLCSGTMDREKGAFGFIKQDSGEEDMFVMPQQCLGFGFAFPPTGSRVTYSVAADPKSGRPRAEDVQPEPVGYAAAAPPAQFFQAPLRPAVQMVQPMQFAMSPQAHFTPAVASQPRSPMLGRPGVIQMSQEHGLSSGTMDRVKGNFGFIRQDSGDEDMFVMPLQCAAYGGQFPPIGARLSYVIVTDPKTGRPRAENVQPEIAQYIGTMDRVTNGGKFGFIKQDCGDEDMFVMPIQCPGFGGGLPPIGARLKYFVIIDPKTGRPRADEVWPADGEQGAAVFQMQPAVHAAAPTLPMKRPAPMELSQPQKMSRLQAQPPMQPAVQSFASQAPAEGGLYRGTFDRQKGAFGFIKQDSGEEDMFVMPLQCQAFGGTFPPIGTRVAYSIAIDPKSGRPRADNVVTEAEADAVLHSGAGAWDMVEQMLGAAQAAGGANAWGMGAQAAGAAGWQMSSGEPTGTMDRHKNGFGFIKQNSGEEDMFVMPVQCASFGGALPPIGTHLVYSVTTDPKTGRPRAENVRPADR